MFSFVFFIIYISLSLSLYILTSLVYTILPVIHLRILILRPIKSKTVTLTHSHRKNEKRTRTTCTNFTRQIKFFPFMSSTFVIHRIFISFLCTLTTNYFLRIIRDYKQRLIRVSDGVVFLRCHSSDYYHVNFECIFRQDNSPI